MPRGIYCVCLNDFISIVFPQVLFFCVAMSCNIFICHFLYIQTLVHFLPYSIQNIFWDCEEYKLLCMWVMTLQTVVAGQHNAVGYFWETVAFVDNIAKQRRKDRHGARWINRQPVFYVFYSFHFCLLYDVGIYRKQYLRKIVSKLDAIFSALTVPTVWTFPFTAMSKTSWKQQASSWASLGKGDRVEGLQGEQYNSFFWVGGGREKQLSY